MYSVPAGIYGRSTEKILGTWFKKMEEKRLFYKIAD
jgi:hypothetical protein